MKAGNILYAFICLLFYLLPASAGQSDDKLTSIESRYFEIFGTDARSVSFVNSLGEHVVEILHSCLHTGSHEFPQAIVVKLQSEEAVEFEGAHHITSGVRGQVELKLRWCASLNLETLCRALTEAYLVRYATFNYGPEMELRTRFWVVSALTSWSYINLRPAQKTAFIEEAREHGISDIASLLAYDLESGSAEKQMQRQGYWILYTLLNSRLEYATINELLERAIKGLDLTAMLAETVGLNGNEKDLGFALEKWWRHQMNINLSQNNEYCDSLEISQKWINELTVFDLQAFSDPGLEDLADLWGYRNDDDLRSILEARCEIIRLRIGRANPAYFNTALSLGNLYKTVLESERKHEFVHALTIYLSDWADAKRLHKKTIELLSDVSESK